MNDATKANAGLPADSQQRLKQAKSRNRASSIPLRAGRETSPLSFAQQRLWLLGLMIVGMALEMVRIGLVVPAIWV